MDWRKLKVRGGRFDGGIGSDTVLQLGAALLLAVYYTLPFLLKLTWWGVRDWDLFLTIAAVPAGSILDYGQFPFWNPYLSGGNILFHHPEVAVLTPFFLLYLIFGAVIGLKLQVLIAYFLGFWGSMRLGRTLGMSKAGAAVAAVAYFGSVHLAMHFAEGHMPFTHYAFLPWFIHFVLEGAKDRRYLIGAIIALALMILGNGAAVPFLYTMMFTGLLLIMRGIHYTTAAEIRSFIAAVVLAIGVAAVKVVPMVVYMVQNRWTVDTDESIPVSALGKIFFGLKHSLFATNFYPQKWAWHEYGAYVSPLLVLLAVFLLVKRFRAHWYWLVLAGFFLLLGLGDFGALSPWRMLTSLPGFSSLRATGRAFGFVILSMAILGGLGFSYVEQMIVGWRRERVLRIGLYSAAGIIVLTNLVLAWPIMNEAFNRPARQVVRSDEFRHVVDQRPRAFENYLANRGSLVSPWLSAYHPSRGLVGPDNAVYPEFVVGGEVEVLAREYTPNVITYRVKGGTSGGELVVGMGFDAGWRADDGRRLGEMQGLISFPVNAGEQTVVLRYRTPYFYHGLAVSLLTLAGMVVWRRGLFGAPSGARRDSR